MRFLAATIAALTFAVPRLALACACCSDPGSRSESSSPSIPLDTAILQLGTSAQIVASDAEPDLLTPVLGENGAEHLGVTTKADPASVVVTLRNGKTFGTIVFKSTSTGSGLAIDIDPFDETPDGSISIYHENRYPLTFRGTGTLAGRTGSATLVLQGTSNACPPEHFDTWHLTLDPKNGEQVQLYGRTKPQP